MTMGLTTLLRRMVLALSRCSCSSRMPPFSKTKGIIGEGRPFYIVVEHNSYLKLALVIDCPAVSANPQTVLKTSRHRRMRTYSEPWSIMWLKGLTTQYSLKLLLIYTCSLTTGISILAGCGTSTTLTCSVGTGFNLRGCGLGVCPA